MANWTFFVAHLVSVVVLVRNWRKWRTRSLSAILVAIKKRSELISVSKINRMDNNCNACWLETGHAVGSWSNLHIYSGRWDSS